MGNLPAAGRARGQRGGRAPRAHAPPPKALAKIDQEGEGAFAALNLPICVRVGSGAWGRVVGDVRWCEGHRELGKARVHACCSGMLWGCVVETRLWAFYEQGKGVGRGL